MNTRHCYHKTTFNLSEIYFYGTGYIIILQKTEIKPENFKGLKDIIEINASDRFKYAVRKIYRLFICSQLQKKD